MSTQAPAPSKRQPWKGQRIQPRSTRPPTPRCAPRWGQYASCRWYSPSSSRQSTSCRPQYARAVTPPGSRSSGNATWYHEYGIGNGKRDSIPKLEHVPNLRASAPVAIGARSGHGDSRQHAAVDDELGPGAKARLVRRQERRHLRDLVRLSDPAQRREPSEVRLRIEPELRFRRHGRLDRARVDRVDTDARRAELQRRRLGQASDGELAGHIRAGRGRARDAVDRREVDD